MVSATRVPAPRFAAILVVIATGGGGLVAAHRAAQVAAIEVEPSDVAWDPFATRLAAPALTGDCTVRGFSNGLVVRTWVPPNAPLRAGVWTFEVTAGDVARTVTLALHRNRRGAFGWRCVECDADGPFRVSVDLPWHEYAYANRLPPWEGFAFHIHVVGHDGMPVDAPKITLTIRHGDWSTWRPIQSRYQRREPNGPGCGHQYIQHETLVLDGAR